MSPQIVTVIFATLFVLALGCLIVAAISCRSIDRERRVALARATRADQKLEKAVEHLKAEDRQNRRLVGLLNIEVAELHHVFTDHFGWDKNLRAWILCESSMDMIRAEHPKCWELLQNHLPPKQ